MINDMIYIILIFNIATYLTFSMLFLLLFQLYFRTKSPYFIFFIISCCGSAVYLLVQNVVYYRSVIMHQYDTYDSLFVILVLNISLAVIYIFTPMYVHIISRIRYPLFIRCFFMTIAGILIIMAFATRMNYYPDFLKPFSNIILASRLDNYYVREKLILLNLQFISIIFFIQPVYICSVLILGFLRAAFREKKIFLGIYLLNFLLTIPLEIFETLWNLDFSNKLKPLTSGNLLYSITNMLLVIFLSKYAFISMSRVTPVIPESLIEKFHITHQEQNILVLMMEGLGNKQIAHHLKITPGTVKNHIYNIYQKAGVQSKVEMINLINQNIASNDSTLYRIVS